LYPETGIGVVVGSMIATCSSERVLSLGPNCGGGGSSSSSSSSNITPAVMDETVCIYLKNNFKRFSHVRYQQLIHFGVLEKWNVILNLLSDIIGIFKCLPSVPFGTKLY
jgi:hypothetical protein